MSQPQRQSPDPISNPDSPPVPESATQPGALRGAVTLTLQTHQAQRLVKGRAGNAERPAIVGLLGFAHLLRAIWHGARADDPYADWWLLQIHAALASADGALASADEGVQGCLVASDALRVAPATSVRPVRTPLRFANPYAYRGAHLLAAYDRLVRSVLTARHIGVMGRDDVERIVALGGRELRRAYLSPVGYRLTGVTREDVAQGTAKAAQAQASMGELPPEVISGTHRAPHAPIRPLPVSPVAAHLSLQALPAKP